MSELPAQSEFLIYEAENGTVKLEVRFEGETVWLTQQLMATLFHTTQQIRAPRIPHKPEPSRGTACGR